MSKEFKGDPRQERLFQAISDDDPQEVFFASLPPREQLSPEEQKALIFLAQGKRPPANGNHSIPHLTADEAREKLILENQGLIGKVAKRYLVIAEFLDMQQDGNSGLRAAIKEYNLARIGTEDEVELGTFATPKIRAAIREGIAQGAFTIRYPRGVWDEIRTMIKTAEEFKRKNGKDPKDDELAEAMGVSTRALKRIKKAQKVQPRSLHTPRHPSDERPMEETIESDMPTPEETTAHTLMREGVHAFLETLDPQDRQILALKYGLDDNIPRSAREVGEELGLKRTKVDSRLRIIMRDIRKRDDLHTIDCLLD